MRLSNLKIAARLHLGFGAVVILLILLVSFSHNKFSELLAANRMNVHTYQVMAEVDAALMSLANIETGQRGFALTGKDASLEPYTTGKEAFRTHVEAARKLTADNPRQQERLRRLAEEQQKWLEAAIDPIIQLRRGAADTDIAAVVSAEQGGKGKDGMDGMRQLIAEIKDEESRLLGQRAQAETALASATSTTLVGGGLGAVLLAMGISLAVAWWLTRNVTDPLSHAAQLARRVASGDLTARIEVASKGEAGELMAALKEMNAALLDIVRRVRTGTDAIATAAGQINSGNQDLSARTEQQAGSLEETASSMEELTSTVKQNADNARQANQLAATASETAVRGGEVVAQVVTTMGSINESARRISDIIAVIDGIAFQTNILALNAAVEAARAGEQGRGFAVVAGEVRNLAQRSASAAKEIKELIGDSVEKVEAGSRLVDQAGATMEEVVGSVRRVTDIIGEIAAASDEQRVGIEQVNQAVTQMDQATQQNAALVEQAAAAAGAMQDQAHELAALVGTFHTGQDAAAPGNASTRAALPAVARPVAPAPGAAIVPRQGRKAAATASLPRREPVAVDGEWETF